METKIYDALEIGVKNLGIKELVVGDYNWSKLMNYLLVLFPELEGDSEFWGGDYLWMLGEIGVVVKWGDEYE